MHDTETLPQLPRLLNAVEVADQLGLSRFRLYELCRRQEVPHVRIGRSIRFDPRAVAAWLAEGGTNGEAA
jgi:excisionase family DNA binding protein